MRNRGCAGDVPMTHPSNEPGKTYDNDERRRRAALNACDGLPTEWLERGLVKELYRAMALIALADKLAEHKEGEVCFQAGWWNAHVRGELDALNNLARPERVQ